MNNFTQALAITVFGMIIVFAVLLILMAVLHLMKCFAPSGEGAVGDESRKIESTTLDSECEDEIIAVLMAAIAASDFAKSNPSTGFKIKSYKRLY